MRLKSVTIKNFRCYCEEVTIQFNDLTTFVGKNDIGKSSILEALEIFFNNDTPGIEANDASVSGNEQKITITCEFEDLPSSLSLDAGAETTLADEYLLTQEKTLKIQKIYDCSLKKITPPEVSIIAYHPTTQGVANLLELKEKDLQQIVTSKGINISLKGNPGMRQAIWETEPNLMLEEKPISVSKQKEDCKRIWEQLEKHLPLFSLFQADRNSRDSDDEVQNPIKAAVTTAIAEVQDEIDQIQQKVQERTEEIARNTLNELETIAPNLAKELTPQFTPPTPAKWTNLFSVNMITEGGIPLNKRGSGTRRLILISFFKAEAERALATGNKRNIIYAVEEPDTSQHPNNQRLLITAFKTLVTNSACQVILTTHNPGLASELPVDSIRFVTRDAVENPVIKAGIDTFGEVADALGVIPDNRVKVLVCVEGPNDVTALKCLSSALHAEDPSIIDLSSDERVAFVVLGGSTLKHWVTNHYLRPLKRLEAHIYDSDEKKYAKSVSEVNDRKNGSWAIQTLKHEMESYLHADAVKAAFGIDIIITDHPDIDNKAVPKIFAEAFSATKPHYDGILGDDKAKRMLAEKAFPCMTAQMIKERDPDGEVIGWFRNIEKLLGKNQQFMEN